MVEWLKALVLKTSVQLYRGFESHSICFINPLFAVYLAKYFRLPVFFCNILGHCTVEIVHLFWEQKVVCSNHTVPKEWKEVFCLVASFIKIATRNLLSLKNLETNQ